MPDPRLPGLTVAPGATAGVPDAAMECSDAPIEPTPLRVLDGALPPGVGGHVFLSGPRAQVGSPLWGAEAVLWRVSFDEERASLAKEFVRNPAWYANDAIENDGFFGGLRKRAFAFADAGSGFHLSRFLGVQDMQNIAPIPVSPELMLVTSDNGRPWTVQPDTMAVASPVGLRADWRPGMPVPWPFEMTVTTAHPVMDKDGALYTTNFMPEVPILESFTHLLRWTAATGGVEHFKLMNETTGQPLVIKETLHQLHVTDRYVVLLESAFQVNFWVLVLNGLTQIGVPEWLLDAMTADADYPFARFWVVEKAALAVGGTRDNPTLVDAKPFPIAGESWHFTANYDDSGGLKMCVLHTPTADISHYLGKGEPMLDGSRARPNLEGWFTNYGLRPGSIGLHSIDVSSGDVTSAWVANEKYTWGLGVHAHRYLEQPWRAKQIGRVFLNSGGFDLSGVPSFFYKLYKARAPRIEELPARRPGAVFALDPSNGKIDGWSLPEGWITFAPSYLPPVKWVEGAMHEQDDLPDGDGHLLVVAVSDPTASLPAGSSGTELWLFDAGDVARGPICRLGLPDLKVGVVVHSCWIAQTKGFVNGPAWDVTSDYDLDAMRAAYESVVPSWLPGQRVWKGLVRAVVKWPEVESLFTQKIYPRFR